MKMLKKGLILLVATLAVSAGASASKKSIAQKADEKIKDNKAEKNRVYFQLAECYRLMYEYPRAERIYKRLAADDYQQTEPMLFFYLAEMCRFENKFSEADEYYGQR